MKSDAYGHASEGLHSREIEKLRRIERFGLKAITGRDIFLFHEYICLITADNIVSSYESRARSANWAEWAQSNPRMAGILAEATKLYAACN